MALPQGEKGRNSVAARFVPDADGKESDRPAGAEEVSAKTERGTDFERFFEGVLSRRSQPAGSNAQSERLEAGPNELELAKETSLSRNETMREGLDNVVRFIRTSGEQKASLIVDPPALGRVSVELTNSATGLEASIKVGTEQIRQLIKDQLAQLRWSLAQQGVQLTHFSVDVQQDNGRQYQGQEDASRRRGAILGGYGEEEPEEETLFRVDLDQGLLYWVA